MDNSVKITSIIVLSVLVLAYLGMNFFETILTPEKTVQVDGQSAISVIPDKISIMFTVETNATTAQEAKDKNALIVEEVITALINLGYARSDIETSNFNIYEDYDWSTSQRKFLGFKTTHSIRVIAKSNDLIGETIDAGVNAGATVSYLNFELSTAEQNKYKALAIKAATEDAKTKAQAMAEGLGTELGDIVSVANSEFNYYPWMAYDAGGVKMAGGVGESVETSIQPGKQDVTARVTVTYQLG